MKFFNFFQTFTEIIFENDSFSFRGIEWGDGTLTAIDLKPTLLLTSWSELAIIWRNIFG